MKKVIILKMKILQNNGENGKKNQQEWALARFQKIEIQLALAEI